MCVCICAKDAEVTPSGTALLATTSSGCFWPPWQERIRKRNKSTSTTSAMRRAHAAEAAPAIMATELPSALDVDAADDDDEPASPASPNSATMAAVGIAMLLGSAPIEGEHPPTPIVDGGGTTAPLGKVPLPP